MAAKWPSVVDFTKSYFCLWLFYRGAQKPNKHKQFFGIVWERVGVNIVYVSSFSPGTRKHINTRTILGQSREEHKRAHKSSVAPYRAILRYYHCDTPYRPILFQGG